MFVSNAGFLWRIYFTRKFTFFISGNAPLITCFVLRSKIIFTNFIFSLMYYNNFVLKIVAKIFLFTLLFRNLKVIWAFNHLRLSNNKLSFITNNVKGIQSLKKRLKLIQYFKSKIGDHVDYCFYKKLIQTVTWNKTKTFMVKFSFLTETKFSRCPNCLHRKWKIYR